MRGGIRLCLAIWALFGASVSAQTPVEIPIQEGLVYGKVGDVELQLDLAQPVKGEGPFPLVVCLHGGAWQFGSRDMHHKTIRLLAEHGYVAATASYRLAPEYKFPAQIEDARCAVRYLRSRARELKIDPDRVAALGDSAGGHLALLLGLMDPKAVKDDAGGHAEQSSRVQAVVNYFGPTDFPHWTVSPLGEMLYKLLGKDSRTVLVDFLGTADRKAPILAQASPVTHVKAGAPPILTFHGTLDPLVPVEQAKRLHEALKKAGVTEELVLVANGLHGWEGKMRAQTDQQMLAFLAKHLKPAASAGGG
jgi:acetyl esterase/lipase